VVFFDNSLAQVVSFVKNSPKIGSVMLSIGKDCQ
jgi:hypothetical protein